jgi:N-terminal helical region fused to the FtsH ternary system vWA domain
LNPIELRDPKEARRFVAQGLWLQRATAPRAASVETILGWSLEIASQGEPMPPVGLVADLGHLILQPRWSVADSRVSALEVPGWPSGLASEVDPIV